VPKRDIRMSDAEIAAFLGGHTGRVIGYNDGGPAPAVLPGTYTLADGALRVSVLRPGQAATALRDDPRVYVIVEQSPSCSNRPVDAPPLASKTYVFYYSVNYSTETVAGAAHVGVLH